MGPFNEDKEYDIADNVTRGEGDLEGLENAGIGSFLNSLRHEKMIELKPKNENDKSENNENTKIEEVFDEDSKETESNVVKDKKEEMVTESESSSRLNDNEKAITSSTSKGKASKRRRKVKSKEEKLSITNKKIKDERLIENDNVKVKIDEVNNSKKNIEIQDDESLPKKKRRKRAKKRKATQMLIVDSPELFSRREPLEDFKTEEPDDENMFSRREDVAKDARTKDDWNPERVIDHSMKVARLPSPLFQPEVFDYAAATTTTILTPWPAVNENSSPTDGAGASGNLGYSRKKLVGLL